MFEIFIKYLLIYHVIHPSNDIKLRKNLNIHKKKKELNVSVYIFLENVSIHIELDGFEK